MKKVFAILSIVLILSLCILPCFADDDVPTVRVFSSYPNGYVLVNGIQSSWSNGYRVFHTTEFTVQWSDDIDYSIFVNYEKIYTGRIIDGYSFTVSDGDVVFISYYSWPVYKITNNLDSSISVRWYPDRVFNVSAHDFVYFQINNSLYLDYPYTILNERVLINGDFYNSDTIFYFPISDIVFDPVSKSGQPIINFYSSLSHLFDPLSNLTTTYYIPLVIFSGIFFFLLMIFVIACVIRRCRNI